MDDDVIILEYKENRLSPLSSVSSLSFLSSLSDDDVRILEDDSKDATVSGSKNAKVKVPQKKIEQDRNSASTSKKRKLELDIIAEQNHKEDIQANDERPKPFEILEKAPIDHKFYSKPFKNPTKRYPTRLQEEYRILDQSLPGNILVRAYEDRMDLLRALIIGPKETPYDNAPIMLDFYMSPVSYPSKPPRAHFYHWYNGRDKAQRINPNLYVSGLICLSILNTWSGERRERWTPKTSSIYQILVSIQGMVLVKEPFYLEPAYNSHRGSKTYKSRSREYSEQAYISTRNFIRHVLQDPPISSFEKEIKWIYLRPDGGLLPEIIKQGTALIEQSERPSGKAKGKGKEKQKSVDVLEQDTVYLSPLLSKNVNNLKSVIDQLRNYNI